jgi:FkbM family methyltransferase
MGTKNLMKSSRILTAIKSRIGLPPPIVCSSVLGVDLSVRADTFPQQPDYDDAWAYALISQCSVFFDVGSNVGEMSLLACLGNPGRRVVTMDANPRALAIAAENLFLNGFSRRIRFVHAFVGETEDQEIEFFTVGTGQAGSRFRSHAKTADAANSSFKVKTTTLNSIARELNLVPDLIKIDIEGAEAEALSGAKELIIHRPRFIVEMHSPTELPMLENGHRVLRWCREVNYDAYYLKKHLLVTSPEVFAGRGRCHLYLQPRGEEYPFYLKEIEQGATLEKAHDVLMKHGML